LTHPSGLPALFAPAERTLPAMLQRQAQHRPDRNLFKTGRQAWTVGECLTIAARSAGALAAAGIMAGDRVALMCGNRAEFMQVYLGCAWLGAIAVPINTASKGAQLTHVLKNCGARLLAIEADLATSLGTVDPSQIAIDLVWVIGGNADHVTIDRQATALPPLGEATKPGKIRPGDAVAILYTSGTTGPAKGVCCPHAQYFWWGVNTGNILGITEGDIQVTTLPLFHTNALNAFYQALLNGSQLVAEPRFSASGFAPSLVAHGATVTYLLGAMVPILMSRSPSTADRAHRTRVALAPGVPENLQQPFSERFGIALVDGFGSTETNNVIGNPKETQKPGWMGQPYHGFQARIVDDDDNELPDGQAGELLLRADEPFAFATGYFGMPEKTVEAWRNLWFHTGDRAIRGADGYFKFVDRLKDAIRRRGENISSYEVEQVLLSLPCVATAAASPNWLRTR
jgi:crotonobetaine/carnitine-CoA ligase